MKDNEVEGRNIMLCRRDLLFSLCVIPSLVIFSPDELFACGGTERWFVKVGTDPDASKVDVNKPVAISVHTLNSLPDLRGRVPKNDNTLRLKEERVVYKVKGHIVFLRHETDDGDYHIVITDNSLRYSAGGAGTQGKETGTSFIAEIPDPNCFAGTAGAPNASSAFTEQISTTRKSFESKFSGQSSKEGINVPVTITGVAFYDRQHEQIGRAKNGIELHPVLDITFE